MTTCERISEAVTMCTTTFVPQRDWIDIAKAVTSTALTVLVAILIATLILTLLKGRR